MFNELKKYSLHKNVFYRESKIPVVRIMKHLFQRVKANTNS